MRKTIFTLGLMLAAALSLTSCSKNEEVNFTPELKPSFELFANLESRTTNDGMSTKWAAGDAINVFHAEATTDTYVSDGSFTTEDATGLFTGTLAGELTAEAYDWYAIYPYVELVTTPANTTNGYVYIGGRSDTPQVQNGNNSTAHIAGKNYPLVGVAKAVAASEKPAITMSHISSLVEFNVTNKLIEDITVTSIALRALEDIVGTYYIDFTGEKIDYTPGDHVSQTATLNVSNGAAIKPGESAKFYMAIKPTEFDGDNILITINASTANGKGVMEIEKEVETAFYAGKMKTLTVNVNALAPVKAKSVTVAEFLAAAEDDTVYELTGVITRVANTEYGNFDLTDDTGTVYIYGLCSPEGESKYWAESGAKIGDTITVQTVRTSYNDTPQGKNAIFVSLVPGESGEVKSVTVAEFLAAAEDATVYQLSGTITSVANTTYGNFDLTDDTGTVYIYGLCSPEGESKYWAESGAKIGDDIVVTTMRTSFSGTPQGKNAIFVNLVSPGTRAFWSFAKEALVFSSAAAEQTIEVSAYNLSGEVNVVSDNSQFSATYASGVLTVSALENTTTDTINGNITVTCGTLSQVITITQSGAVVGGVETSVEKTMADFGWAHGAAVTEAKLDNNVIVKFAKGGASTAPAYYTNNNEVRLYQNGATMTINAGGCTIKSIEIKFANNQYYIAPDCGTFSAEGATRTWTGEATEVKFTTTGTDKDHRAYIVSIKVTYIVSDDVVVKETQTLSFPEKAYSVVEGETFDAPKVIGAQTTVTYTSSNTEVATVDANGVVTILGTGETTITATAVEDDTYQEASASYTLTVTPKPVETDGSYTLLTNLADLKVGDKVVIAAKDYNYAMSTNQADNNRGQAAITKSGDTITFGTDVQILTVEAGKVSGTFAFNTGKGYLYAASSSKNYLKTEATLSNNSSWKVTFENDGTLGVKAQGTNARNVMQYNQQSSLFACYGTASQKAIVIYRLVVE